MQFKKNKKTTGVKKIFKKNLFKKKKLKKSVFNQLLINFYINYCFFSLFANRNSVLLTWVSGLRANQVGDAELFPAMRSTK